MLQSMGMQRVGYHGVAELNWSLNHFAVQQKLMQHCKSIVLQFTKETPEIYAHLSPQGCNQPSVECKPRVCPELLNCRAGEHPKV